MTGHMFTKRINKTGNYKSKLDWDIAFKDNNNPEGNFKMFIQPIQNSDGEYEIRYMKTKGGYIVSGEGYIVTDRNENEIDKKFNKEFREKWNPLVQKKVENENELW